MKSLLILVFFSLLFKVSYAYIPPSWSPIYPVPEGPYQPPPSLLINHSQFSVLVSNLIFQTYVNEPIESWIRVKNIGNETLHNLRVIIYDLPPDWYSINPEIIDKLDPGSSTNFLITYTPLTSGSYKFRINVTSDETFLSFDSLLLAIELKPEEMEEVERRREEVKKEEKKKAFFEIYSTYFIIFGFIAPVVIAIYMIFFLLSKRCPLCGGKMKEYKGKNFVYYKCTQCKNWKVKE